jgi:uncharacterized protein (DUF305 family)
MNLPLVRPAVVLLLSAGLVACSGAEAETPERSASTAPVVQLGAPGGDNRTLGPEEQLEITTVPHTEADVSFARDMLQHHAQAVVMTGYVDERTDTRDVQLLAKRMSDGQQDEIRALEEWLIDRGETVNDLDAPHGGHGAHDGMAGMLTDEELAQLEAARGAEFDLLFLQLMTRHHEGALAMVADLYAADGGAEPEMGQIAQHIDSDQRIEIARMAGMLADL